MLGLSRGRLAFPPELVYVGVRSNRVYTPYLRVMGELAAHRLSITIEVLTLLLPVESSPDWLQPALRSP